MKPFDYGRAADLAEANAAAQDGAFPIAGGTNLIDLMKLEVETPDRLIDVNRLPLAQIEPDGDGIRIGALVSNSDCAAHPRVRRDYAVLSQAILAGASGQLRNKATTGGNLCQRTRCYYFTDRTQPCNKREPGTGCGAMNGFNRIHAILGASDACIATYPGDMAVAMAALDATVLIESTRGERDVPVRDFHRLPGAMPEKDNVLEKGELIVGVRLRQAPPGRHAYRKVRDRSSYAFALVSIAAVIAMEDGKIANAQLAFGGIAHKPWHDSRVEQMLVGETPSAALFDKAADLLLEGAQGYGSNDFKIPLARRTLHAVLAELTGA
ncbi:MAG: xanthine dehydrogenase [Sphingomonas sp. 28-66-16]|nr:MAG: xanthine dehydrogenase [Sphingomonas sp. 28-66-16]